MNIKVCKDCEKEYLATLDYFYADYRTFDGLQNYCKKCKDIINKRYAYKENVIKRLALTGIQEKNKAGAMCGSIRQNRACSDVKHISPEQYINGRWKGTDKWADNPDYAWRFWFGKYKNKPVFWVAKINPNYITWCLKNVDDFKRNYNKFRNANDKRFKTAMKQALLERRTNAKNRA